MKKKQIEFLKQELKSLKNDENSQTADYVVIGGGTTFYFTSEIPSTPSIWDKRKAQVKKTLDQSNLGVNHNICENHSETPVGTLRKQMKSISKIFVGNFSGNLTCRWMFFLKNTFTKEIFDWCML